MHILFLGHCSNPLSMSDNSPLNWTVELFVSASQIASIYKDFDFTVSHVTSSYCSLCFTPIKIPLNHYKLPLNHYKIPLNHYKIILNHYKIPLNHYKTPLNHYKIPLNHQMKCPLQKAAPTFHTSFFQSPHGLGTRKFRKFLCPDTGCANLAMIKWRSTTQS